MLGYVINLIVFLYFFSYSVLADDKTDSTKIASLDSTAFALRNSHPDSALSYARRAIELAQNKNQIFGLSTSYNVMGILLKNMGRYDSAMIFYSKSLQLREESGLLRDQATIYMNMGQVKSKQGEYLEAINYYMQSLDIQENLGDSLSLNSAKSLENLAVLWDQQGDLERAMSFNLRSLNIYRKKDNLRGKSRIHNNIGILEMKVGNESKAIHQFKKSIKLKKQFSDVRGIANSYNNLGDLFLESNQLEEAILYYNKALEINKSQKNQKGIASSLIKLAQAHNQKKHISEALNSIHLAIDILKTITAKNDLSLAFLVLSEIHRDQNNYRKALNTYLKYDSLNKLIFSEAKFEQIAELQTKYETEKKERQIADQKVMVQEATSQRNNLIITLLALMVMAGAALVLYAQRNRMMKIAARNEEMAHSQEITQLLQEQEIKSMDAMIEGQDKERKRVAEDLHDRLGATLSATKMHIEAIEDQVGSKQAEYINKLIDKAVEDTRQISHNMLSGILTKFGLMAALKDLKDTIEATDHIEVKLKTIQFDERLDTEKEINLYRVIQELVSNTLKHAGANQIIILLEKKSNQLSVTYEDNGKGFDPQQSHAGIGLKNIKSRIAKIGGTLKINAQEGRGSTTVVDLET